MYVVGILGLALALMGIGAPFVGLPPCIGWAVFGLGCALLPVAGLVAEPVQKRWPWIARLPLIPARIEPPRPPLEYLTNRQLLSRALAIAYKDGASWYGRGVEPSEWAPWEQRTQRLIRAALGEVEADRFISDWNNGTTLTGLDARLQRLFELIRRVDSVTTPLTLQPDFDGRDWVSRR